MLMADIDVVDVDMLGAAETGLLAADGTVCIEAEALLLPVGCIGRVAEVDPKAFRPSRFSREEAG